MHVCFWLSSHSSHTIEYRRHLLQRNYHLYACIWFNVSLRKKRYKFAALYFLVLAFGRNDAVGVFNILYRTREFWTVPNGVIQRESCTNRFHAECL